MSNLQVQRDKAVELSPKADRYRHASLLKVREAQAEAFDSVVAACSEVTKSPRELKRMSVGRQFMKDYTRQLDCTIGIMAQMEDYEESMLQPLFHYHKRVDELVEKEYSCTLMKGPLSPREYCSRNRTSARRRLALNAK
jgi:hypothetical protein